MSVFILSERRPSHAKMKKTLLAAALALSGCVSVDSTSVLGSDIVTSEGEAMYVIQASVVGVSAIFHIVDIVSADLDVTVNKMLVAEAKLMGANKVVLLSATTTPRHGLFAVTGTLIGFPSSTAVGIAVKVK